MRNLITIALLTLRELSRRRLVIIAFGATLVLCTLTAYGFHALASNHRPNGPDHHDILMAASMLEIALAFMFSFILALASAFLGALSLGSEIENGVLLAILPRPIRRIEVLAGKWLGSAIAVGIYASVTALLEFEVVRLTTGYFPPQAAHTIAFLVAQSLVLLTLTMTLSVVVPPMGAGFITVVLYGIGWITGIVGQVTSALGNEDVAHAATIIGLAIPSDGLWRAASFSMEPVIARAISDPRVINPLVPAAPPTEAYYLWALAWCIMVFLVGARTFVRRDI